MSYCSNHSLQPHHLCEPIQKILPSPRDHQNRAILLQGEAAGASSPWPGQKSLCSCIIVIKNGSSFICLCWQEKKRKHKVSIKKKKKKFWSCHKRVEIPCSYGWGIREAVVGFHYVFLPLDSTWVGDLAENRQLLLKWVRKASLMKAQFTQKCEKS